MKIIEKLLASLIAFFASGQDDNLSIEECFRISFTNVVNTFLLFYCFISGVYSLMCENLVMSVWLLCMAGYFLSYFMLSVIHRGMRMLVNLNAVFVASAFLAMFMIGCYRPLAGVAVVLYPFVSMTMQSRRVGAVNSMIAMVALVVYSFIPNNYQPIDLIYSPIEMIVFSALMFSSLFIYYSAMRGISVIISKFMIERNKLNDNLIVKNDLIESVSRQLRTPLSNIVGATEMLSRTRLDNSQYDYLNTLHASAHNMLSVLDEIVNAANNDTSQIPDEDKTFNLHTLLNNTMSMFSDKKGTRKCTIIMSHDVPTIISGNSVMVKQVFVNIVESLLHFDTERKITLINISVSLVNAYYDTLTFSFKIEAYGLTFDSLFESELLVSSAVNTDTYINALRLNQTKRLISSVGNELQIDVDEDAVSVVFSLPFHMSRTQTDMVNKSYDLPINLSQQASKQKMLKDAKVLVVEDNLSNQRIIGLYLNEVVASIDYASNGKEALENFENSKYDIVLMDLQMPVMGGFKASQKIREMETSFGTRTPIIAVTANTFANDLEKCKAVGIDGYISKPFMSDELVAEIKKHIEH